MYNGQLTTVNRFTSYPQPESSPTPTAMAHSSDNTHRPYQGPAPKPRAIATHPGSSPSSAPSVPVDRVGRVAISNLMSPPEPTPHENFTNRDAAAFLSLATSSQASGGGSKGPNKVLISPPDSPEDDIENDLSTATGSAQDPILYPEPSLAAPAVPLFALEAEQERQHQEELGRLDSYMLERSQLLYPSSSVPTKEEYQVFIDFKFYMMKHYLRDPRTWLKMQRESLDRDATAAKLKRRRQAPVVAKPASTSRYTAILPAKRSHATTGSEIHVSSNKVSRVDRSNRVTKPAADRPAAGPSRRRPSSGGLQANSNISGDSPSSEPQKRITSRDDKDFGSLPDYCPPLSSLPNRPNCLKVDWKGAPIDLSNDPDRNLLHPDELSLASTLRLDCATYLTSKRRIFIRLAENSAKGRAFRKTDAQQACHIDVNKASKLWTAYDKVGWLNVNWVKQFMKPPTVD